MNQGVVEHNVDPSHYPRRCAPGALFAQRGAAQNAVSRCGGVICENGNSVWRATGARSAEFVSAGQVGRWPRNWRDGMRLVPVSGPAARELAALSAVRCDAMSSGSPLERRLDAASFWNAVARHRFSICGTVGIGVQKPPGSARDIPVFPLSNVPRAMTRAATPMGKRRQDRRTPKCAAMKATRSQPRVSAWMWRSDVVTLCVRNDWRRVSCARHRRNTAQARPRSSRRRMPVLAERKWPPPFVDFVHDTARCYESWRTGNRPHPTGLAGRA